MTRADQVRFPFSAHPSLSWVTPSDGWECAHRVLPDVPQFTVCGVMGTFTVAGPGKGRCPTCFPPRGSDKAGGRRNVVHRS